MDSPIQINEVSTDGDWFELKNTATSGDPVSLNNYQLSQSTALDNDDRLVSFGGKDYKVPAGGVILIVSGTTDADIPDNSPLAGGINAAIPAEDIDDRLGTGATSMYWMPGVFDIKAGASQLILRNNHADDKLKTANNIVDITGGLTTENTAKTTKVWPIIRAGAPNGKVIDGGIAFTDAKVYSRAKADGFAEAAWTPAGYTGIGYKRSTRNTAANGGTPGYANNAAKVYDKKSDHADYVAAPVTISEIMYHTGRNLPQWIELYNHSLTDGVNLDGWTLKIENDPDDDDLPIRIDRAVTLEFADGKIIPPNQTVLIVTSDARRKSATDEGKTHFPDQRVINIYSDDGVDSDPLDIKSGTSRFELAILSQTAFKLTLQDKGEVEVDEAGNLGEDWALPTSEDRSGNRHSIIRRYDEKNMARPGTDPIGIMWDADADADADADPDALTDADYGWLVASVYTYSPDLPGDSYYGSSTDLGTPGYRRGGALPVSLSKFRPERIDSGAVVVRWITESELNNAGFNILRSETRDGEFTKLNTKLIAGQGTISERTVYEFADTSAKPNVVYYYQIQDVSLDGKVQTLRQSRIKGQISAAGKLTTIWGEIKALQ